MPLGDAYQALLTTWLDYLQADSSIAKHLGKSQCHQIAGAILETLVTHAEKDQLPCLTADQIAVAFNLWHQLLTQLNEHDLSPRDAAFFVFSLKSSLTTYLKKQVQPEAVEFSAINQFLDFLARLTFELYTAQTANPADAGLQMLPASPEGDLAATNDNIMSHSPAMRAVYKAVSLILTNDVTVLLQGESGTGKDVLARLIHYNSSRKTKPFVAINCGAIPKDLIESELFGYEKGAFTGADSRRIGKIEQAHSGTLFLDEIGDLNIDLQVKLLRIIQNRTIDRIGGTKSIPIDVRIIAATHTDLEQAVSQKTFRLDLYYRLNVYPILIPPLRDRPSDIVPLAQFFIKKYCTQFKYKLKSLSPDAQAFLEAHPLQGNIRELENLIQRAVIMSRDIITRFTLQIKPGSWYNKDTKKPVLSLVEPDSGSIRSLDTVEAETIQAALRIKNGNIKQVAEALGISRTTLYNKAKRYDISI